MVNIPVSRRLSRRRLCDGRSGLGLQWTSNDQNLWIDLGGVTRVGQRPLPERVQLIAQRLHSARVEAIDPAGAGRLLGDQSRTLEDLQMLGYRRAADR